MCPCECAHVHKRRHTDDFLGLKTLQKYDQGCPNHPSTLWHFLSVQYCCRPKVHNCPGDGGGRRTRDLSVQRLCRITPSMVPQSRLEPKWPCFRVSETGTSLKSDLSRTAALGRSGSSLSMLFPAECLANPVRGIIEQRC